jgi:hypothetical protein
MVSLPANSYSNAMATDCISGVYDPLNLLLLLVFPPLSLHENLTNCLTLNRLSLISFLCVL